MCIPCGCRFVSYLPASYVNRAYADLALSQKQQWCLISNTCMAMGANLIAQQESNGAGMRYVDHWRDLSPSHRTPSTLARCVKQ